MPREFNDLLLTLPLEIQENTVNKICNGGKEYTEIIERNNHPFLLKDDILPPKTFSGEVDSGTGGCPITKPGFSGPARKLMPAPPDFQKNHCPCILEGHFSTNPILSAFHLQGPKSNTVHPR
jgi:hypothetical protein